MNCTLCKRPAKYLPTKIEGVSSSESFHTLEWKKVDLIEYTARKKDGRTVKISEVCPECMAKYNNGQPPLGLQDINKMREKNITEEEYYKQHRY